MASFAITPYIERGDDLARNALLHGHEGIIRCRRPAILANLFSQGGDRRHQGIGVGESLILQTQRMHLPHPIRQRRVDQSTNSGLRKCAVQGEIGLGNSVGGRKATFVCRVVAPERSDIVECPRFAAHDPVAADEIGICRIRALGFKGRFVKAGRQRIDQVDVAGELTMLFSRHAGRDKDAQVTDLLVNGVDDGLTVSAHLLDVLIEIENPAKSLLRRRDIVSFGAEDHDRRADLAQIDCRSVRSFDCSRGQIIADEQLIDDELHFLGIQVHMTAPPALEFQITRRLGVDLRIEIVLLAPQGVGRILIFKILHQPAPSNLP